MREAAHTDGVVRLAGILPAYLDRSHLESAGGDAANDDLTRRYIRRGARTRSATGCQASLYPTTFGCLGTGDGVGDPPPRNLPTNAPFPQMDVRDSH